MLVSDQTRALIIDLLGKTLKNTPIIIRKRINYRIRPNYDNIDTMFIYIELSQLNWITALTKITTSSIISQHDYNSECPSSDYQGSTVWLIWLMNHLIIFNIFYLLRAFFINKKSDRERKSAFLFVLQRCFSFSTSLLLKPKQDLTKVIYCDIFMSPLLFNLYSKPFNLYISNNRMVLQFLFLFICISNFQNKPCAKTTSQPSPWFQLSKDAFISFWPQPVGTR